MIAAPAHLRIAAALVLIGLWGSCAAAWAGDALPRTMAWSAYNLGTTGNSQAVAIGKMLKDRYGVSLRVLPGKNDVSRLLPLVSEKKFQNGISIQ